MFTCAILKITTTKQCTKKNQCSFISKNERMKSIQYEKLCFCINITHDLVKQMVL